MIVLVAFRLLLDSTSTSNVCRTCLVVSHYQPYDVCEVLFLSNISKSGYTSAISRFFAKFTKVYTRKIFDLVAFAKVNSRKKFQ